MKKLIVFGATGTVGKHIIDQELSSQNQITAFCRNREKMEVKSHANLTIIEGDVLDPAALQDAIQGQDVVIITLGSADRNSTIRSIGTKNIIDAMKATGVRRLICQSTLGAGDSNDNLNFFWKHLMFGWFLKKVFLDHELQEQYVKDSGLDWTIVRPAAFTNGELTANYRHGFSPVDRTVTLKVSRADVAHFVLQQVDSDAYLHLTPGQSY